jgi:hypothetical protein
MISGNVYKTKIFFTGGINNDVFNLRIPSLNMNDPCNLYDLDELMNKCKKFLFFTFKSL